MRKTSYFITFSAVAFIFALNVLSSQRPDWLVVYREDIFHTKLTVSYGFTQRCELVTSEIPDPSGGGGGTISYRNYECKNFPPRECWDEIKDFCPAWTTAGYVDFIAMGFAALALLAIVIGVTTHSRRRRIWRAVVGLVLCAAICQIATFAIVTKLYHDNAYPSFERARPGLAYIVHTISWVSNILIIIGVITTGISADAGHKWAAGNRAYQPIAP